MGCETQLKTVLCYRRSWIKRPRNRIGYDRSYSNFDKASKGSAGCQHRNRSNINILCDFVILFYRSKKLQKKLEKHERFRAKLSIVSNTHAKISVSDLWSLRFPNDPRIASIAPAFDRRPTYSRDALKTFLIVRGKLVEATAVYRFGASALRSATLSNARIRSLIIGI